MFSRLDLMSEHPECVSGHTIFTITKNISAPPYWALEVYGYLKSLNLRLALVVREFLIHENSILDLRRLLAIIDCFSASYISAAYFAVGWRPKFAPVLSFHRISQCESTMIFVMDG